MKIQDLINHSDSDTETESSYRSFPALLQGIDSSKLKPPKKFSGEQELASDLLPSLQVSYASSPMASAHDQDKIDSTPSTPYSLSHGSIGEEMSPCLESPISEITHPDLMSENQSSQRREFICAFNSNCQTGQYTLDLSRKTISNHFGRNKAATLAIDRWPLFCRKHYQRATYLQDKWQKQKIDLIEGQLHYIQHAYPGTTYEITLKKSEQKRVTDYLCRQSQSSSVNDRNKSKAPHTTNNIKYEIPEDRNDKGSQMPMSILVKLFSETGRGKTMEDCLRVTTMSRSMLESGEIKKMPDIEFLPELPVNVISTARGYRSKTSGKQKPVSMSRVTKKGSVQKP